MARARRTYQVRRRYNDWSGYHSIPEAEKIPTKPELVWLAKHKKAILEEKTISIKCLGGKIHKIIFRFPGRITLVHHPDLVGEKTMMGLGGEKPECLVFLEQWQKGESEAGQLAYSRPIVQTFLQARRDWRQGREKDRASKIDKLQIGIKDRLMDRVNRIHEHLVVVVKRFLEPKHQEPTKAQRDYWSRYPWAEAEQKNRCKSPFEEEGMSIKPIIKISCVDLINHKPKEDRK